MRRKKRSPSEVFAEVYEPFNKEYFKSIREYMSLAERAAAAFGFKTVNVPIVVGKEYSQPVVLTGKRKRVTKRKKA
jgi:hypothetical protein